MRKSVLIELARLDEPTEQLRLWEEIKTGQLTTVRATRARKTTPAPSKPDIDKTVANGQRLVTAIKALAQVRETLSDADYQRLLDLYQDIRLALDQLAPRRED